MSAIKKQDKPELRFPEFSGNWERLSVSDIFSRITSKNVKGNTNVLTISAQKGLVAQGDFFTKSVASKDLSNYTILERDDFAYNKSYSKDYPMGAIKRLALYDEGVVSPLYICLRLKDKNNNLPVFFEQHFDSGKINTEIAKIAQEGARNHGLLNMSVKDFFDELFISKPNRLEQEKITTFLTKVDALADNLKSQIHNLESFKRGMMQKIFLQEVRFRGKNNRSFPAWETSKWKDIFEKRSDRNGHTKYKNVLTNSALYGVVKQRDYFEKDIANQNNLSNYFVVENDDFVYNPRISSSAPVGPLKRNKIGRGIMSPLYTILSLQKGNHTFYEYYFDTNLWHEYMMKISNFGARHDRMNIRYEDLMEMPIPFPSEDEQERIATFFASIDALIEAKNQQSKKISIWKNGLMQKMFI